MTNREKLIQRLENASPYLLSELEYYLELDRDYYYDIVSAFTDLADIIEERHQKDERKLWTEIKQIYIDIGFLEPFDKGYIEKNGVKMQTISGKRYPIHHNKKKYEFTKSWNVWINER